MKAVQTLPSGGYIVLDTTPTEELVAEGFANEIAATIQKARKAAGLELNDHAHVWVCVPEYREVFGPVPQAKRNHVYWFLGAVQRHRLSIATRTVADLFVPSLSDFGGVADDIQEFEVYAHIIDAKVPVQMIVRKAGA